MLWIAQGPCLDRVTGMGVFVGHGLRKYGAKERAKCKGGWCKCRDRTEESGWKEDGSKEKGMKIKERT